MSVQVDDHRSSYAFSAVEQKFYEQRYVGVWTKACSFICAAMMKASTDIYRPAVFDSQLSGQNTATSLKSDQTKCEYLNIKCAD